MISMKRAFVFLVMAPLAVFFTVLLIWVAATGTRSLDFGCVVAAVLSMVALPMSVIGWTTDQFLFRAFPLPARMCLTAMIGATVAAAELLALFSSLLPPSIMTALAGGGAIVMAMCSLLSNDYSGEQRHGLAPVGA
jgi:hypothetical protein